MGAFGQFAHELQGANARQGGASGKVGGKDGVFGVETETEAALGGSVHPLVEEIKKVVKQFHASRQAEG